jgi:hypothetical protein
MACASPLCSRMRSLTSISMNALHHTRRRALVSLSHPQCERSGEYIGIVFNCRNDGCRSTKASKAFRDHINPSLPAHGLRSLNVSTAPATNDPSIQHCQRLQRDQLLIHCPSYRSPSRHPAWAFANARPGPIAALPSSQPPPQIWAWQSAEVPSQPTA